MSDTSRAAQGQRTIAAQAAGAFDAETGGVVPAIHMATTFGRDADYAPLNPDNIYQRCDSENVRAAENLLAALEGAGACALFPSGMAAVAAVLNTLPAGASVLVQKQIYYGTTALTRTFCERRGLALHEVDTSDTQAVAAAVQAHQPALIWVETPSNPWLRITDIAAVAKLARPAGALLAVDSTAATPVMSQPLQHGADIVMHSATKAINGHSDVLAGALCVADTEGAFWQMIQQDRHQTGATLGPMEAWLLLRGMRTLPLRMRAMAQTALHLASHLAAHDRVEAVVYPGLATHPGHAVAAAQMSGGFGSLLSVVVKGGAPAALAVAGRLRLFHRATSLGGVESLVEHRHTIEPHTGIPEGLLRLSVGIEEPADLMTDLMQALGG